MQKEKSGNGLWWKRGVIYHIYVRSFADSNNDGIGDIPGIIQKLPYLTDLGIEAIWLSPVFASPDIDFGYDVSDYLDINPDFGTLDDFHQLIGEAHSRGIRVIMDLVLNHTSEQHPWFSESRSSRTNSKRDWYIWKDGREGKPPNNWMAASGGSAWKFDTATQAYYLHSFFPEQPDLNWRNPDVTDAFFGIVQYWLDLGVDGFRLDVINFIIKDKKFRNNPNFLIFPGLQQHLYTRNRGRSYKIVKKLRQLIDQYEDRMTVGEIYMNPPGNPAMAASYLGKDDNSLNLAFDFSLIFKAWNAKQYFKSITSWQQQIPQHGWPCHVLSNHDLFRNINRIPWRRNQLEKAKVAAVMLLTLRGTPFIYYGEEIGMPNSRVPRSAIKDPFGKRYWPFFSGRDKARTPMQWNGSYNAGFTQGWPWLPIDPRYKTVNVDYGRQDPESLFNVYRTLIHMRQDYPALHSGTWVPLLDGGKGVMGYFRASDNERIIVFLNYTGSVKMIRLPDHLFGEVLFSTRRPAGDIHYINGFCLRSFEAILFLESTKGIH